MRAELPIPFFKSLFILPFFLTTSTFCKAQCPLTSDVFLSTQADVDNFPSSCTNVVNSIFILSTDITDLSPLSHLTSIDGRLIIVNNLLLTNLNGLENLTSIGEALNLINNPLLTNINGLDNLASIGEELNLITQPSLTNINGLHNLRTIGGFVNISGNPLLTNIDGLHNLRSIGRYANITSNPLLTNIDGLANVTSVDGDLLIRNNIELNSCCGICPSLTNVRGIIEINDNAKGCNTQEEACSTCAPPIPTLETWGLLCTGILLLSVCIVAIKSRQFERMA